MDFKIRALLNDEQKKLEQLTRETMLEYFSLGYKQPNYALTVIDEVYNDIFRRESIRDELDASRKDKYYKEFSQQKSQTIDILRDLTKVKLYKELIHSFKQGEEFSITFEKTKPDEATADFFNLGDAVSDYLNITRTDSIRTPVRFHAKKGLEVKCTPEGDYISTDHQPFEGPSVDNTDLVWEALLQSTVTQPEQ